MSDEKPEKFVQTKGARKKAPEATIDLTVVDDRFEIAKAFDKKDPQFIHSWMMENDATASALNSLSATVVKRGDGSVVRHNQDILIARPVELVLGRRKAESARSLKAAVAIAGDRDKSELVLTRNPKAPRRKKGGVVDEAKEPENDVQE